MNDIKPRNNLYVIRTATGKEEQLIESIIRIVGDFNDEHGLYDVCFSLAYEDVWRYQGRSYIDIKRMFPGYIFIVTDEPERMYEIIKRIPQYAQLMSENVEEEKCFLNLPNVEAEYLFSMIEKNDEGDYCVHRSFVVRRDNRVVQAYGALEKHLTDVVQADYKKRRVIVEKQILGQTRRIKFCIYDECDCRIEGIPSPLDSSVDNTEFPYRVGDEVWLSMEGYDEHPYAITRVQANKSKVYVAVELFGREVEMQVGIENIV